MPTLMPRPFHPLRQSELDLTTGSNDPASDLCDEVEAHWNFDNGNEPDTQMIAATLSPPPQAEANVASTTMVHWAHTDLDAEMPSTPGGMRIAPRPPVAQQLDKSATGAAYADSSPPKPPMPLPVVEETVARPSQDWALNALEAASEGVATVSSPTSPIAVPLPMTHSSQNPIGLRGNFI